MQRLVIFLVRKKLKLKKYQLFRFKNQKSKFDVYYFTEVGVMKVHKSIITYSGVSLNWLLNHKCEIEKVDGSVSDWC